MLQGLAPERVFTVGTVSKSLAPTIRVGWVLAPPAFATALAEEKLLADRGTDVVTFRDWQKIEAAEIAAARDGSPREKFTSIDAMLAARGA